MWKDGSRFWLAGAIEVVGTSFRFVSANTWSEETPNNKPGITIDNLLTQTVDSATQAFCEGSKLSVTVNDALTNEALENVTATILRLDDGEEQVIAEGAFPDSNGELSVSLLAAGHYEVQVSGAGYVSSRKSIGVTCSPPPLPCMSTRWPKLPTTSLSMVKTAPHLPRLSAGTWRSPRWSTRPRGSATPSTRRSASLSRSLCRRPSTRTSVRMSTIRTVSPFTITSARLSSRASAWWSTTSAVTPSSTSSAAQSMTPSVTLSPPRPAAWCTTRSAPRCPTGSARR